MLGNPIFPGGLRWERSPILQIADCMNLPLICF